MLFARRKRSKVVSRVFPNCGFAAAQCGKAPPYRRGSTLKTGGYASDHGRGIASQILNSSHGKAEPSAAKPRNVLRALREILPSPNKTIRLLEICLRVPHHNSQDFHLWPISPCDYRKIFPGISSSIRRASTATRAARLRPRYSVKTAILPSFIVTLNWHGHPAGRR